jgi:hypothetical protein
MSVLRARLVSQANCSRHWVVSGSVPYEDVTLLLLDPLETGLPDKELSRSEDKGSEDVAAVLKEHVKNAAVVLL